MKSDRYISSRYEVAIYASLYDINFDTICCAVCKAVEMSPVHLWEVTRSGEICQKRRYAISAIMVIMKHITGESLNSVGKRFKIKMRRASKIMADTEPEIIQNIINKSTMILARPGLHIFDSFAVSANIKEALHLCEVLKANVENVNLENALLQLTKIRANVKKANLTLEQSRQSSG